MGVILKVYVTAVILLWVAGLSCLLFDKLKSKAYDMIIDIEKLKEEFAMKNNICKECDSFKKCDNKTYSKSEICEKFIWVPTILEEEGE